MKTKILLLIICGYFSFSTKLFSQSLVYGGWINFGSTFGQKLQQNGKSFSSTFSPDIEFGMAYREGESNIGVGFGIALGLRFINTEHIDWFDNSYKCAGELYVGPSILIPFDDFDTSTGLIINPFVGYSLTGLGNGGDQIGSFTVKLSADIFFHGISIGAFWRPLKQNIKGHSSENRYGSYGKDSQFDCNPSFGIRIGYTLFEAD